MNVEAGELCSAAQSSPTAAVHAHRYGCDHVAELGSTAKLVLRVVADMPQDFGDDLGWIAGDAAHSDVHPLAEEALWGADEIADDPDLGSIKLIPSLPPDDDLGTVVADHRRMGTSSVEEWSRLGLACIMDGRESVRCPEV